jgi:hypothetical protein
MPNMWYNRAYLLSTYALTGRHEQPEARNAVSDYNSVFSPNFALFLAQAIEVVGSTGAGLSTRWA